ncbi:P-loop NTPase fold protein [Motilimonas sp. E26]|uniref:P-loop NTPase fold protein n=1 Tax=Motilimonas sp. E26 TaxID=2865674 RepID=UPI001E482982|nr:P-loop NTPase fold protein [Motilimonas sp. E26]MCE0558062.1 KAP family NTPase [Motilimonas sp. E26]
MGCAFRWLTVIIYAISAWFIVDFLYSLPMVQNIFGAWVSFANSNDGVFFYLVLGLGAALIINKILVHTGDSNPERKLTLIYLMYPPAYFSIVLVVCGFISQNALFVSELFISFSNLNFTLFSGALALWHFNKKGPTKNVTPSLAKAQRYTPWHEHEGLILNASDDKFRHFDVLDSLQKEVEISRETNRGIVLYGDFGSGKSSIIKMLSDRILDKTNKTKWVISKFDAWGRLASEGDAQKLLLNSLLADLSKQVSVSSLYSMPDKYVNVLSGTGNTGSLLSKVIPAIEMSPLSQLKRIDTLLQASNLRLLLVIEDIDRNGVTPSSSAAIAPLLDQLSCCQNIRFIFTIGFTNHLSNISNRIAVKRFDLSLPEANVKALIEQYRTRWIESARAQEISLIDDLHRWVITDGWLNIKGLKEEGESDDPYEMDFGRELEPLTAVIWLCKTPRMLKAMLREVDTYSDKFKEFIPFDVLLCWCALKVCDAQAFGFVMQYHRFILEHGQVRNLELLEQAKEGFESPEGSSSIIYFLFPKAFRDVSSNQTRDGHTFYLPLFSFMDGGSEYLKLLTGMIDVSDLTLPLSDTIKFLSKNKQLPRNKRLKICKTLSRNLSCGGLSCVDLLRRFMAQINPHSDNEGFKGLLDVAKEMFDNLDSERLLRGDVQGLFKVCAYQIGYKMNHVNIKSLMQLSDLVLPQNLSAGVYLLDTFSEVNVDEVEKAKTAALQKAMLDAPNFLLHDNPTQFRTLIALCDFDMSGKAWLKECVAFAKSISNTYPNQSVAIIAAILTEDSCRDISFQNSRCNLIDNDLLLDINQLISIDVDDDEFDADILNMVRYVKSHANDRLNTQTMEESLATPLS